MPLASASPRSTRGQALLQVLLLFALWLTYSAARVAVDHDLTSAVLHGRWMLRVDQAIGLGWLDDANRWVTDNPFLALPLCYAYASLHYLVTAVTLVWLWRFSPRAYPSAVTWLAVMSLGGLAFYLTFPTAPPRFLPGDGFVDTLAVWSGSGWWADAASAPRGMAHLTNQVAAFPSLHVGWAVWCATVWRRNARARPAAQSWLYPVFIGITVVLTANHYLVDVAAGVVLAHLTGWGISRTRRLRRSVVARRRSSGPSPRRSTGSAAEGELAARQADPAPRVGGSRPHLSRQLPDNDGRSGPCPGPART